MRGDLTGRRFGRLTVQQRVEVKHAQSRWLCRCDCGSQPIVWRTSLISGDTKSCGCGWVHNPARRHGHNRRGKRSETYQSWACMIKRVTNPNYVEWDYYGGRGVSVCEEWRHFDRFLSHMGERPAGTSLDRINANGDYGPDNCRWATTREQRANRRDS